MRFTEELPFVEAAEIGTEKVIKDHATIGIVITTDGSIGELSRNNYIAAEDKVISELKEINKPFIVVLNSVHPNQEDTLKIVNGLKEKYNVPVLPISVENMTDSDMNNILQEALYEFPIDHIEFQIPDWVGVLNNDHHIKAEFLSKMKSSIVNVDKLLNLAKVLQNWVDFMLYLVQEIKMQELTINFVVELQDKETLVKLNSLFH